MEKEGKREQVSVGDPGNFVGGREGGHQCRKLP